MQRGNVLKTGNDEPISNGNQRRQDDTTEDRRKKTFHVVFVYLLLDLVGFTIILPLLPSILDYYSTHDKDGLYPFLLQKVECLRSILGTPDRFNSVLFGGMIGSLFSFLQFTSSPIIGALSDVYGRRPMLLITTFGIMISYAVWSVSSTFTIFVIARIIGGVCKGNVSLSTAIVTDVSDQKTRGRGMAMIGIAFSIGFIVGPVIGALFARRYNDYGIIPSYIALGLVVIDLIYIFMSFEETLPKSKRTLTIRSGLNKVANYISPLSLFQFKSVQDINDHDLRRLKTIGRVYFMYLFLYSGLEFTLTFLTHMRFSYTRMEQGRMFVFMGIIMIAIQGGYVRKIAAGKEIQNAIIGLGLIIPSFLIVGISTNQFLLYVGLALYSFSTSLVVPCLTTVVSSFGSSGEKGTVMGIFRSIGALARAVGPLVASLLYWCVGPHLCYIVGGLLLSIPLIMLKKLS